MRKIKAFFYVYFKSLTSLSYYSDILKTKFSFSVKYYLFLAVVASLIGTAAATFSLIPGLNKSVSGFAESVKKSYPENLVFTIKNGEWDINVPQPLIIPFPEPEKDMPKNLIVLYKDGTINDLDTLDTLILVNKVNVITKGEDKIEVYPIKNLPDTRFDKGEFVNIADRLYGIVRFLPYLLALAIFAGLLVYYLFIRTTYLLFVGAVVWIVAKIAQVSVGPGGTYRISLHTMTLPVTLALIFELTGLHVPILMWFFVVNLGAAIAVIIKLAKNR